MENENKEIRSGDILIANPFLQDPTFKRSVVLMTDNSEGGAMGFILNNRTHVRVNEAIKDFPYFESYLYLGGPVEQDVLFYIHTLGDKLKNSVKVSRSLHWGGDFEQLVEMIESGEIKPNQIRFFLGYSGWGVGQLAEEMVKDSWTVSRIKKSYLFNNNPSELWGRALKDAGSKHAVYGKFAYNPSLN